MSSKLYSFEEANAVKFHNDCSKFPPQVAMHFSARFNRNWVGEAVLSTRLAMWCAHHVGSTSALLQLAGYLSTKPGSFSLRNNSYMFYVKFLSKAETLIN